ncbi:hypothetical protein [Commensalibacter oyaizuii]|uniref:DUF2029 domain-containing protein n=1 Tax=Commensalibacter oyaizuii TaxID=3043873 RepID=A0ABT6Q278_9PROT|nr:hypothetical protein [Commensalibacter sp. TBRC 16381]MDI2091212.1 hypothetical protein [Commensalibacter sp. TBRC 16381]
MECLRSPDILIYGRFWEDEAVLFQDAWTHSDIDTIFRVYGGYLNLAANFSIWIAKTFVPLQYAPFFTSIYGLIFQIIPLFLLLTASDQWLSCFKTRLLLTLLLIFVPEHVELSMESLHTQFTLIIAIVVIILLKAQYHQRYFKLFILVLASLSSMIAVLFVPILGIKLLLDRQYLRLEQFFFFTVGCCIQFFVCYSPYEARSFHFSLVDFLTVLFTRNFIAPFIGIHDFSIQYLETINQLRETNTIPILPCIGGIIILSILIFCLYQYPKTRWTLGILFLSLLNIQFICIYGSIGPISWFYHLAWNQRYVFLTETIFVLILVFLSTTLPKKGQYFCYGLGIWLCIVGAINFFALKQTAPSSLTWKTQVSLWKQDPNYTFYAWPGNHVWKFTIPKQ